MKKFLFLLVLVTTPIITFSQCRIIGRASAEVVEPITYVRVNFDSLSIKVAVIKKEPFFITKKDITLVIKNKKIKIPQIIVNYN